MTKVKMTSTGVHIIGGLYLKIKGQMFELHDPVFSALGDADKERLVAVVRQQDFRYGETSIGYIWDFTPDENGVVTGVVRLGMNDKGIGTCTPIHTNDIIGWCYLD